MKNLDAMSEAKAKILQKMSEAIRENDTEKYTEAFNELSVNIQESILGELHKDRETFDSSVLAARGSNVLTTQEREYYTQIIEAMKSSNPKQALSDVTVVLPKTTIDRVFDELTQDHPLLDVIDFQNTSGLIELFYNTDEGQLAQWGQLTGEIVKELTSGFAKKDAALSKLSAFLPLAKAYLDLGPEYLDRYVRTILVEAIYNGLETGIVTGTGKDQPIGMDRQVGEGVSVTDGVYPQKDAVKVTKFDPETYGKLLAALAKSEKGKYRKIDRVLLVVNPADYFKLVMPATTLLTGQGTYVNNVFPFPTVVVQSVALNEGEAIIGLPRNYFMGIGTGKEGRIEYSDEYHFLEDERVYLVKLYGWGTPKDNTSFTRLDISKLKATAVKVEVVKDEDSGN